MDTQNYSFTGDASEMKGRWVYGDPMTYGHTATYQVGMDWLAGMESVEDWGCGGGGAKPFCKAPYKGIDGSHGPCTDQIEDLRSYRSSTPGLFMRHVLEHNLDWNLVLGNALASFTHRMSLIMFLSWSETTHVVDVYPSGIVVLQFKEFDILEPISPWLKETSIINGETLFLLEK